MIFDGKENEGVTIREAVTDDIPVLKQLEQGVVAAERQFTDRLKATGVKYYDLEFLIESRDTCLLVAVANNEIIGSGYAWLKLDKIYFEPRRFAYLGFMYVVPEWRGQRVIQSILQELLDWSKSREVTTFKLDVYAENHAAINAYKKFGFKFETVEMSLQE